MDKILLFFIGTEAELMKMFTTILEARKQGYRCLIVASGQNEISQSPFLKLAEAKIDIDLTKYSPKERNSRGYLKWIIKTRNYGINVLKEYKKNNNNEDIIMIVHGDTLSTLLGATIARRSKIKYMHVESGLRSYNLMSPFPEEIDRFFGSLHSEINFCPKEEYTDYAAKRFRGKAVNTYYNTGIETLYYAIERNKEYPIAPLVQGKYFMLAIHRQENIYNKSFMEQIIKYVEILSSKIKCVFIYHLQTQNALERFKLWERVKESDNIIMIERKPYCEFINIVDKAEFVIADGCGNQQEFYYMGKPYLIMRSEVEKNSEGLGWNAECFENNFERILGFADEYLNFKREPQKMQKKPSRIIVDSITQYFKEK